jgi:hypothetical protein
LTDIFDLRLPIMSARRRGVNRGNNARGGQPAETSSRRGDRLMPPGAFDGPASRGSASQSGPGGRGFVSNASGHGSPAPTGSGFEPQAPTASSRRSSQSGGGQPVAQAAPAFPAGDPARDPAAALRTTDRLKNVDLPPSFYNIDAQVSHSFLQVSTLISHLVFKISLPNLEHHKSSSCMPHFHTCHHNLSA